MLFHLAGWALRLLRIDRPLMASACRDDMQGCCSHPTLYSCSLLLSVVMSAMPMLECHPFQGWGSWDAVCGPAVGNFLLGSWYELVRVRGCMQLGPGWVAGYVRPQVRPLANGCRSLLRPWITVDFLSA
jgi:hypothetical protein